MENIFDKILGDRETRYTKIQFLKKTFKAVILVKSNFPGLNKRNKIAYVLVEHFSNLINSNKYTEKHYYDSEDGPYYLFGSNCSAYTLKAEFIELEENSSLGRFIDIDVYNGKTSLTRGKMRKCFLCDDAAFVCRKANRHLTDDLISYVETSVLSFFLNRTIEIVNNSIMLELDLHPKFGLVTPLTNGSHSDMNYDLMILAKDTILPHFRNMFIIGWSSKPLNLIFNEIRKIGLKAEKDMFAKTNNINAYKGLIFNLGILLTAYSYCTYNLINRNSIRNIVAEMTKFILDDFKEPSNTFGYLAFKNFNILGVRGEVAKGFPNVYDALNYLTDFSFESRMRTLMYLISINEDTVLLKRSNSFEQYIYNKNLFKSMLTANQREINELDIYCREQNLSFGGSADLLVLTIFLKTILS